MSEEEDKGAPKALRPNIKGPVESKPDRQPMRVADSKSLAEKRAAELRAHRVGASENVDEFDVSHLEPDGWTYQWHTWSVYEARQTTNMMASEDRGWQPVPRSHHPQLMPRDSDSDVIIRKGAILMMMPTEIVEEYKRAEAKAARDQIRWKEQQIAGTPEGTLPRGEDARTRPKINKGYEPMPVPDK